MRLVGNIQDGRSVCDSCGLPDDQIERMMLPPVFDELRAKEITDAVTKNFLCYWKDSGHNPGPQFSLGVNVHDVVQFVLKQHLTKL